MNRTNLVNPVVFSDSAVATALVFCISFVIIGVVGNGLTIVALAKHRKLRTSPTSVFIVSLSVTDLIFCAFNLPVTGLRYAYQKWTLGSLTCRLFPFFFYLNVAASLFTMCGLTINRYVLIAHYSRYEKIYRCRNLALMILFCWLLPLALLLPPTLEVWGRFGYDADTFSCTVLRDEEGRSPKKFFFLLGFFLPCAIIVIAYLRILVIVRASRKAIESYGGRKSSTHVPPVDELTLTRMILTIFSVFLLCYLPLMIVNVFDDHNQIPDVHVIASILAWSASVINPFIYGLMSTRYRQAYLSLLPSCLRHRKSDADSTTSTSGGPTTTADVSVLLTSLHTQMVSESRRNTSGLVD